MVLHPGPFLSEESIGILFPRSAPRRSAGITEPVSLKRQNSSFDSDDNRVPMMFYGALSDRQYVFGADGVIAPESSNPSQIRGDEKRSFIIYRQ
jgi:hypothetical protein